MLRLRPNCSYKQLLVENLLLAKTTWCSILLILLSFFDLFFLISLKVFLKFLQEDSRYSNLFFYDGEAIHLFFNAAFFLGVEFFIIVATTSANLSGFLSRIFIDLDTAFLLAHLV